MNDNSSVVRNDWMIIVSVLLLIINELKEQDSLTQERSFVKLSIDLFKYSLLLTLLIIPSLTSCFGAQFWIHSLIIFCLTFFSRSHFLIQRHLEIIFVLSYKIFGSLYCLIFSMNLKFLTLFSINIYTAISI